MEEGANHEQTVWGVVRTKKQLKEEKKLKEEEDKELDRQKHLEKQRLDSEKRAQARDRERASQHTEDKNWSAAEKNWPKNEEKFNDPPVLGTAATSLPPDPAILFAGPKPANREHGASGGNGDDWWRDGFESGWKKEWDKKDGNDGGKKNWKDGGDWNWQHGRWEDRNDWSWQQGKWVEHPAQDRTQERSGAGKKDNGATEMWDMPDATMVAAASEGGLDQWTLGDIRAHERKGPVGETAASEVIQALQPQTVLPPAMRTVEEIEREQLGVSTSAAATDSASSKLRIDMLLQAPVPGSAAPQERGDKGDRGDRGDKGDKGDKGRGRGGKVKGRGDRADRPDRDRANHGAEADRAERGERGERSQGQKGQDRRDGERADRAPNNDRDKVERDKVERDKGDRADKVPQVPRADKDHAGGPEADRADRADRADDPRRQPVEEVGDNATVRKHSSMGCAVVSLRDPRVREAILRASETVTIANIKVQLKPHFDKDTNQEVMTDLFVAWGRQVEKTTPLSERDLTKFFDTKHQELTESWRVEAEARKETEERARQKAEEQHRQQVEHQREREEQRRRLFQEEVARRQQAKWIHDLQGTWAQSGGMAPMPATNSHASDPRAPASIASSAMTGSTVAGGPAAAGQTHADPASGVAAAGLGVAGYSQTAQAAQAAQWSAAQSAAQWMQAMTYHPQQGWQQQSMAQRAMPQMQMGMPATQSDYENQMRAYYAYLEQQHRGQTAAATYAQPSGYISGNQPSSGFGYGVAYSRGEHI